jgi:hypothetical protein
MTSAKVRKYKAQPARSKRFSTGDTATTGSVTNAMSRTYTFYLAALNGAICVFFIVHAFFLGHFLVHSRTVRLDLMPVSPMDDQIRRAEFRAIYRDPAPQRYAFGPVPPIHIIVRDGQVALEGVVANQGDKNLVNIRANAVPGVFSVTNNLRIESSE